jgi:hypothetical protein
MDEGGCRNGTSLSEGALLGNLQEFVYLDFWEKKKMHIWVSLPWTQRILKVKPGGHLEF